MNDVRYASLTSQGVQHRVLYRDGHPSRYQPRPTELNFGEQTGTGAFPLVIAVPHSFLFAAHLFFSLQGIFFVCSDRFLFAAHLFCLQRWFFVCSDHFLFAAIVFCLQHVPCGPS